MSGLDILIVEDEVPLAKLYSSVTSADGHAVTLSVNGFEALEKIQGRRFDLVLLDINLGSGPDGFDVLRSIRELNRGERVVMITARGSPHDIETGLITLRADNYLVKPMGEVMFRVRLRAEVRQVQKIERKETVFTYKPLSIRVGTETCCLIMGSHTKLLAATDSAVLRSLLLNMETIQTPEMLAPIILGHSVSSSLTATERQRVYAIMARLRERINRFLESNTSDLGKRAVSAEDVFESVYSNGWRCKRATADI